MDRRTFRPTLLPWSSVSTTTDIKTPMDNSILSKLFDGLSVPSECTTVDVSCNHPVYKIILPGKHLGNEEHVGTGTKYIQSISLIGSFLFFLGGMALIVVGVNLHRAVKYPNDHFTFSYTYIVLTLAIGVTLCASIVLILCRRAPVPAETHSHQQLHLTIIALALCCMAFAVNHVVKDQIRDILMDPLLISLQAFNPYKSTESSVDWNQMQLHEQCCGLNNYTDWKLHANYAAPLDLLPSSCCGSTNVSSTCLETDVVNRMSGCVDSLLRPIERYYIISEFIIAIMAFTQVLDIVLVYVLTHQMAPLASNRAKDATVFQQNIPQ